MTTPRMTPSDARQVEQPALDDLLCELREAFDAAHGQAAANGPVGRLETLMSGLELPAHHELSASDAASLVDVTLLRVRRSDGVTDTLSSRQGEVVDACVAAGFELDRVPRSLRREAGPLLKMGRHLTQGGPAAPDGLVERTLGTIAAADQFPEPLPLSTGSRWRMADLVSVAAMLVLAFSIGWPAVDAWRAAAMRADCASNLRAVASAVGLYGGDYREQLPAATAGFGGGQTWWNVGRGAEQSNSANLFTLTRAGYAPIDKLACSGNDHAVTDAHEVAEDDWRSFDDVSYSYRIITRSRNPRLGSDVRFVVLADRSPVVVRAARGEAVLPRESSLNHGGRGQQVLWSDGSVEWASGPVLPSGDHIFLPQPVEAVIDAIERFGSVEPLRGTELPARETDNFLGP